ncbi:salivary glue protein Sgs-3-like [Ochlerotatus camptorhynchus]|uniref:salivary glue protein Sgs-3-like n=1 Tax=Ochlerotatus camptorhynchus TaxID=644619 RepID=UPI0031CECC0A
MALDRIVTVVGLLLPLIQSATIPVDQTLMFKEIDSLLRRCPCVPINTCYSQGVNLNEQTFLNLHFHCPDHTFNHCCGPYFPTLGSEDFYFDEGSKHKNESRRSAVNTEDSMMIVMAQNSTTERPEILTKVVLVYPESTTTKTTTMEVPEETTTEFTTLDSTSSNTETTMMDEETTTEPVTTTTVPSTTESTTTTTTTAKSALSTQSQRKARLQNRPPLLKKDLQKIRSTKAPRTSTSTTTSTTTTTTTSTTLSPVARRFPTRKALNDSEFHRQFVMSRLRMLAKSSTTTTTEQPMPMPMYMPMPMPMPMPVMYYDDDYDDEEDDSYEDR